MLTFCRTCTFFTDKQGPGKTGTCRRFPPNPILSGMEILTVYPEVKPDMRACGEHKKDRNIINVDNAAGNVEIHRLAQGDYI